MRKISIFILSVCCCCCAGVQAQTSGYLGKRLLVSLDFDLAPDVFVLVDGIPEYGSWIHQKQGLGLSYVVKNKRAVGFYLNHYRNVHQEPVLSSIYFDADNVFVSRQSPSDFDDVIDPLSDYVRTSLTELGISYQYYLKSFVAPVGSYFELELGAVIGKSKFYDEKLGEVLTRPVDESKSAISPKISLAYMHNHIIQDKLVLRYGYEFGWDIGGSVAIAQLNGSEYENFMDTNYMGNRALARSLYASVFNFKLGIGLIP